MVGSRKTPVRMGESAEGLKVPSIISFFRRFNLTEWTTRISWPWSEESGWWTTLGEAKKGATTARNRLALVIQARPNREGAGQGPPWTASHPQASNPLSCPAKALRTPIPLAVNPFLSIHHPRFALFVRRQEREKTERGIDRLPEACDPPSASTKENPPSARVVGH